MDAEKKLDIHKKVDIMFFNQIQLLLVHVLEIYTFVYLLKCVF